MKHTILIYFLFALSQCLKFKELLRNHQTSITGNNITQLKTGGYNSRQPSAADKPIDEFVRSKFSELQGVTLINVSTQVVNGYNHKLTYEKNGLTWTITVYEDQDGKYEIRGAGNKNFKKDDDGQTNQIHEQSRIDQRQFNEPLDNIFKTK